MDKKLMLDAVKLGDKISKENKVVAVVLFGSQATGKAHKDSDVDVTVIADSSENFGGYSSESFDVSSFSSLPLLLKFRVVKEGIVLKCNDSLKLSKIYADTMRKYLDFSSFMHGFYNKVIHNV